MSKDDFSPVNNPEEWEDMNRKKQEEIRRINGEENGDKLEGRMPVDEQVKWMEQELVRKDQQLNKDISPVYLSEDHLALEFVNRYCDDIRFDWSKKQWALWTGARWEFAQKDQIYAMIREICRHFAAKARKNDKNRLERASTISAVNRMAMSDQRITLTSEAWDTDDYLLGTPGGVVDLRTGELRQAERNNLITLSTLAPPSPAVNAPIWKRFLKEATGGDEDLQHYLAKIAGMALTGDISEEALFFIFGNGKNGKSVFLTAISEILGDYGTSAPIETFTSSYNDRHPTELAMLYRKRLVSTSETEANRTWAESRIKQLTGGDMIPARRMYGDFFIFKPQFTLLIVGNHKPGIRSVDESMKRRLHIIPFRHTPERVDLELNAKLRTEYPSILRWMIDGCIAWQKEGLTKPQCVIDETEEYFATQDSIGNWITECCNVHGTFRTKAGALYESWKQYAEQNGIHPGSSKSFAQELGKRGYKPSHTKTGNVYEGLALKARQEEKPWHA